MVIAITDDNVRGRAIRRAGRIDLPGLRERPFDGKGDVLAGLQPLGVADLRLAKFHRHARPLVVQRVRKRVHIGERCPRLPHQEVRELAVEMPHARVERGVRAEEVDFGERPEVRAEFSRTAEVQIHPRLPHVQRRARRLLRVGQPDWNRAGDKPVGLPAGFVSMMASSFA